jgi:membrane-associated protease RseP (regulator of RpoE activity)
MNAVKQVLFPVIALAFVLSTMPVRAADAPGTDAEKFKAYDERIKALEQHIRDLESKLDGQTAQGRVERTLPRNRQFTRDRFEEMMNQMRHEMENGGAFGPGFGPWFGPNAMGRPSFPNLPGYNPGNHMRLGVQLEPVTPELAKDYNNDVKDGAFVHSVVPGSPAEKAGVLAGDAITHFDNQAIKTPQDIIAAVKSATQGKHDLVVSRRGQPLSLKVELGGEVAALDEEPFENDNWITGSGVLGGNGNAKVQTSIKVSALELGSDLARELKLSETQTKQVTDILAKHAKALSDEFTKENPPQNGGLAVHGDLSGLATKHADNAEKELAKVLSADQLKQWNDYRHSHSDISFSQSTIIEGGGIDPKLGKSNTDRSTQAF